MSKDKKRIYWIDYLKGLAILSVVFLHSFNGYTTDDTITGIILKYITSFHMALFFSISGYLFTKDIKDYKGQIKKKIKTLVVPYAIYGIAVGFLLENIRVIIRGHEFDLWTTIGKLLTFKISYLAGWFLIVLFEVYILEYIINYLSTRFKVKDEYITILHVSMLIIGFLSTNISLLDVFKIKLVLISSFFFHLGYIIRKINIKTTQAILLTLIGGVVCYINKVCTYSNFEFGFPILFTISSCCSIIGWINLIRNVHKNNGGYINKQIISLGEDSIIVLLTHPIYLYAFRMFEKITHMDIHTFPPYAIFILLIIMELFTIKYIPKVLKKTFGK